MQFSMSIGINQLLKSQIKIKKSINQSIFDRVPLSNWVSDSDWRIAFAEKPWSHMFLLSLSWSERLMKDEGNQDPQNCALFKCRTSWIVKSTVGSYVIYQQQNAHVCLDRNEFCAKSLDYLWISGSEKVERRTSWRQMFYSRKTKFEMREGPPPILIVVWSWREQQCDDEQFMIERIICPVDSNPISIRTGISN